MNGKLSVYNVRLSHKIADVTDYIVILNFDTGPRGVIPVLYRVIYASEAVGVTGASTLSIAQILGVSERNNRRDHVTGCVMFHQGHILQALEGGRIDLDRLMKKIVADPRHRNVRVLIDQPIATRRMSDAMCLCGDPEMLLDRVGMPCLSRITANEAESMLDLRRAA